LETGQSPPWPRSNPSRPATDAVRPNNSKELRGMKTKDLQAQFLERGAATSIKCREASLVGADGVVGSATE
jgi:hypothetical protein